MLLILRELQSPVKNVSQHQKLVRVLIFLHYNTPCTVYHTAPSGPPLNFMSVSVSHDSISFQWSPPREDLRNGNITHYSLSCNGASINNTILSMEYIVTGLSPFTVYKCEVTASTSAGEGPPATIYITTNQSGRL